MEMQNKIYYRPWVKKLFYASIFLIVITELIIYRLHYQKFESAGLVFGSLQFLIASGLPLGILLRLIIVIRPRIFSEFELHQDKLIIRLGKKESVIEFSQINSVSRTKLPAKFLGGFTLELQSGRKLYFSSIIKNEEFLLEALQKHSPNLLDGIKNKELILEVKETDRYWNHIQSRLRNPYYMTYKLFLIPFGFSLIYLFLMQDHIEKDSLFESIYWALIPSSPIFAGYIVFLLMNLVFSLLASHWIDKVYLKYTSQSKSSFLQKAYYPLCELIYAILLYSLYYVFIFL
jgi:hypothetical protein